MNGINWKRILLGTLTGGVAWFILGTVRAILRGDFSGGAGAPALSQQPGADYLWVTLLGCAAFAGLAGWLYASIRPRYGPGPATAVRAGLALGCVIEVTDVLWASAASASLEWRITSALTGILVAVAVTLLVAWTYKETEASSAGDASAST